MSTSTSRQDGSDGSAGHRDAGGTARNLTVFDGSALVNGANPNVTVNISGFQAPATGTVNARVGFVGYDDARIAAAFDRMCSRNGHACQCQGTDNKTKSELLPQRSVSHVSTPLSPCRRPVLRRCRRRLFLVDGIIPLPAMVTAWPILTKQ